MTTHLAEATAIVKKYTNWSFVGGLIPVPAADVAAVLGVQVKMIYDLTKLYEIPFKRQAAQTIIGSLLGSVTPGLATSGVMATGIKLIPIIGTTLGVITMPTFSAAATYAVGRVFITHFETGGTLLDFNAEKMREHFRSEFESKGGNA